MEKSHPHWLKSFDLTHSPLIELKESDCCRTLRRSLEGVLKEEKFSLKVEEQLFIEDFMPKCDDSLDTSTSIVSA